jgi:cell division protein ZapB
MQCSGSVTVAGAIDRGQDPHYIDCMTDKPEKTGIGEEIDRLESRVELLLNTIERLQKENSSLRAQQETLTTERANLLEKHDMVRTRVEGMITRLKSMESGA